MMASADEGGAGGLGRRQNLDNLPAPRQPTRVCGVRLKQRAPVILCDPGRLFRFVSYRPDKLRTML
jgi:hypothetical protein